MTDPIADMLTRIRNASAINMPEVVIPFSKIKFEVAKILAEEGYIKEANKIEDNYGQIVVKLKYENDQPAITSIKRVSKVGRRLYVGKDKLPNILNNLGIAIITTSQGIMTNKKAKKLGLGGEVICEVY